MTEIARSLVFTGHMIDLPARPKPRFPARLEGAARAAIAAKVEAAIKPGMVGFASGARGGDILFHEIARGLGLKTVLVLPFAPEIFEEASVAGVPTGDWVERFHRLWSGTPEADRLVLNLAQENASYMATNVKLIELAAARGAFHLIALWDGQGGDGPGGTEDMVLKARAAGAGIDIIAPEDLEA